MLNSKGLEAAILAAAYDPSDSANREWMSAAITAYLTASMPEDVKGLVDSLDGLPAGDVLDEFDAQAIEDARTTLASLSAKAEELTRLWSMSSHGERLQQQENLRLCIMVEKYHGRVEAAEASLAERDRIIAEKDKALEPFAREAGRRTFLTGSTVNDELLIGGSDLRNRDLLATRAALGADHDA